MQETLQPVANASPTGTTPPSVNPSQDRAVVTDTAADGPSQPDGGSTDEAPVAVTEKQRLEALALLASIFVIAACGLIYELLIATVSSYLLGSSVTQFSISIGVFIGAMGLGSHLSQRIRHNLLGTFILIEIVLGLAGGISVLLLFYTYATGWLYWLALYATLIFIGALTGLELPLLTRLLKPYGALREVIARALSFDYVGALTGSLLFPLLLLPTLGLTRTAFLIGMVNVGVAAWNAHLLRARLPRAGLLLAICALSASVLLAGLVFADRAVSIAERGLYDDEIIYAKQTPYQRLVVTRWREDLRLFIDGNLQFSSVDEYRYHEALIHPAMSLLPRAESVLLLGGGDGLAVREVAKYRSVKNITLIDIDPAMTQLGQTFPAIAELNGNALRDPRVRVINDDAYKFLERNAQLYDVIVADLPDPNNDALAKLYSVEFYKLVKRHLSAQGVFVTQATSSFFSRETFWCIHESVDAAGLHTLPYHAYVPSFGDWGFVLAAPRKLDAAQTDVPVPAKFLTRATMKEMFVLPRDIGPVPVDTSTLDRPTVIDYYRRNNKQWE
jgi:spermidine synthase